MRPSVDSQRLVTPVPPVPTTRIHTARLRARELIEENVMRATTVALLAVFTACVPDAPREARPDGGVTADPKCASMETVTKDLVVSSGTMTDTVPTGCWTLDGKLTIRGTGVTSLSMLGDVRGANEILLDNTKLATFDTKSTLEISGPIRITNNAKLAGIDKLHAGTTATLVLIDGNPLLTSLDGAFDDIAQVASTVTIRNNAALASVEMPKLELVGDSQIGQSLLITNNAALATIDLPAFTYPNRLEISNNAKLSSIGDLPAVQIVSDLVIRNNPQLATLPAFPSLQKIGGNITISGNQTLSALGDLPVLALVVGTIAVDSNPALTSIGGLPPSLAMSISGLSITNNTALTDLGRLAHESYGAITITNNTSLNNCKAREVDVCTNHSTQSTINGNHTQNNCTSWCGR